MRLRIQSRRGTTRKVHVCGFIHNADQNLRSRIPHNASIGTNIMKIIATLLLITSAVSAYNNVGESVKDLLPNAATLKREHFQDRLLEVSDQCLSDTDALYSDAGLAQASAAYEAELGAQEEACISDFSSANVECSIDSEKLSSQDAFIEACENAGGQSILYDFSFGCQFSVEGTPVSFNIDMKNVAECLALTCNEDNWNTELDAVVNELVQITEQELSTVFSNVQCTGSTGGNTSANGPTSSAYGTEFKSVLGMMAATAFVI